MRSRFANTEYEPEPIDRDQRMFQTQPKIGERTNEPEIELDDEDRDDREPV